MPQKYIDPFEVMSQKRGYVIVLSVGRSGSASVAERFNLLHEPDGPDVNLKSLQNRIKSESIQGESSHYWKGSVANLFSLEEECSFFHLIREGKKVIASLAERGWYGKKRKDFSYRYASLKIDGWSGFTQIEKLCWHWVFWNKEISKLTSSKFRLEDMSERLPRLNCTGKPPQWKKDWNEPYNAICKEFLIEYGYV